MLSDAVIMSMFGAGGLVLAAMMGGIPSYVAYKTAKLATEKMDAMNAKQDELHKMVDGQTHKLIEVEKRVSLSQGQSEGAERLMASEKEVSRLTGAAQAQPQSPIAQQQADATAEHKPL